MKRKLISLTLVLALILSLLPATALAADDEGDGYEHIDYGDWNYYVNDGGGSATIAWYTGSDAEVITPTTIGDDDLPVTRVATSAFAEKTNLTHVTISEGVTVLGDSNDESDGYLEGYIFDGCTSLTTVDLPQSLTSMGARPFLNCTALSTVNVTSGNTHYWVTDGVLFSDSGDGMAEYYPVGKTDLSYTIPDGIKIIDYGAFDNNCPEALTLPGSMIDAGGFRDNSKLKTLNVSEGVTSICGFVNCPALSEVNLPSTLKQIGAETFELCRALNSIDLPGALEEIGSFAFAISGLNEVTIPASVTTIGDWAFSNCFGLQSISVAEGNLNYKSVDDVLYTKDGKDLIQYPSGKHQKSFAVPAGVEHIHGSVFNNAGLDDITLSDNLKIIDGGATFASNNFQRINIPASVEFFSGEYAFSDNPKLTQLVVYSDGAVYNASGDCPPFDGSDNVVLYGHSGSTTQSYASANGIPFSIIPSAISLSKLSVSLKTGEAQTLTAATAPAGGLVKWSSSDATIASVDANGKVTANAVGNATITAVCLDKTAACTITVTPSTFTVAAFAVNPAYGSVSGAGTYGSDTSATLAATPNKGFRFVRWTENGTQVSTSPSFSFTVTKNTVLAAEFTALTPVSLSCTKTDATVYKGVDGSVTVSASGGDSGTYEYSINGGTNWQSTGTFSGLPAGTYTAAVRDAVYTDNAATGSITVGQPAYAGSIQSAKVPKTAEAGTAMTIIPPAAPKGYTIMTVTYASSDPSVATVDANGNVTFLKGGKVTITVTVYSQMSAMISFQSLASRGAVKTKTTVIKKTITVKQPVSSISLNLGNTTIARTQKVKLAASLAPLTASNKKVKWTSSNPKVAAVSSSGVVTGKAGGTAIITCMAKDGSGVSASCTVTVTPIYPTGLKLSKTALTVKTGKTASLKTTISPKNTDFKTVTWVSSNPAVATVDAKGKIKAIAPGIAVITATASNGFTSSCTVTIK